jgi:hypothetical protein
MVQVTAVSILLPFSAYSTTIQRRVICSYEISVNSYQTIRHHTPEDGTLLVIPHPAQANIYDKKCKVVPVLYYLSTRP